MKVEINKQEIEIDSSIDTLAKLLADQKLDKPGVAAAVENTVVPRASWPDYALCEGMKIIVINAVCGG